MTIYRRDLLKLGALLPFALQARAQETKLDLTFSGYPFEHVKGLIGGAVEIDGAKLTYTPGKIGDINSHLFDGPRELAFTEVGFSPYLVAFANDDFRAYSLIPVFPFRTFRHKSVFVHADGAVRHPADLKGKRVAVPGYSSTSLTWIRGIMQDEFGVRPEDIEWLIAAEDSSSGVSGAISKQETMIPEGISYTIGPEGKDESDLLIDRKVDALFHAAEPRAFVERHAKVRRLFPDSRKVEREYYEKTGIFPMMHVVAIKNDLVDRHPWLPKAVFDAYSESKSLAYEDIYGKWFLRTLPWFAQELEATEALMGRDFNRYGIEPNRRALEALLRYTHQQGFASRQLEIDEIFHPRALDLVEGQMDTRSHP